MVQYSNNAHVTAQNERDKAIRASHLERCEVLEAPDHTMGDDFPHVVKIAIDGTNRKAIVMPTMFGDTNVPEKGNHVWVLRRQGAWPIVIGSVYQDDDQIPDYKAGERRLGHPLTDANIYLDENGNIRSENSTGLVANLGTQGDGQQFHVTNGDSSINMDQGSVNLRSATTQAVTENGQFSVTNGSTRSEGYGSTFTDVQYPSSVARAANERIPHSTRLDDDGGSIMDERFHDLDEYERIRFDLHVQNHSGSRNSLRMRFNGVQSGYSYRQLTNSAVETQIGDGFIQLGEIGPNRLATFELRCARNANDLPSGGESRLTVDVNGSPSSEQGAVTEFGFLDQNQPAIQDLRIYTQSNAVCQVDCYGEHLTHEIE